MKTIALVFAGGTGQRMGTNVPKQFLQVCGKEIIIRTLELFERNNNIDEIYAVCIDEWRDFFKKLLVKHEINKVASVVAGGKTGQDSIYNGLKAIKENNKDAYILIHDGVRPLVSNETINKCIECLKRTGSAITITPCFETPIVSEDGLFVDKIINRNKMYNAQAPQCFCLQELLDIHDKERKLKSPYNGIVDTCSLMFKYGKKSSLVEGNRGNVKVTTIEDLFNLISNYNYNDYKFLMNLNSK